jgi:DNA-nicking Smr family endonuclease
LTAEERALWRTITRSVRPIRNNADGNEYVTEPPPAPVEALPATKPPAGLRRQAPQGGPAALPQVPLGRRLKQRVARGSEPLDARLDLHGMTQERAHRALLGFLRNAQADHAKLALDITGKGRGGSEAVPGEGRGVLKRIVPLWLGLPEFRPYVLGFEPAHVGHGGEGALYVRLRRAR